MSTFKNGHLNLRDRCQNCGKIPYGKLQEYNYKRYKPFCSFQCQEFFNTKK